MEFELSFKNPVVSAWVIIMVLSFILATLLIFLTDIPRTYISLSQSIGSWTIFIAWFLFYNRKKKLA